MLLYQLRTGHNENKIARQCVQQRLPLPKAIQDAPELLYGLEFAWNSFWLLSSSRQSGFGLGRIPYSVILDYCQAEELDAEDTADLTHLIQAMDAEWLAYNSSATPKPPPKSRGK